MSKKEKAASSLNIYLLGPFRIEVDGVPVASHHWPRRKAQLLVKILALQPGHQLHREQLMEILWPDTEPETASQNLHRMIYIARRTLEPRLSSGPDGARTRSSFIVARGQQVTLRAPGKLWVDALEFERHAAAALKGADAGSYMEALALYRGDLLLEDPYEDWAIGARDRLRARYKDLLVKIADLYEAAGEHLHAIEQLARLAGHDPTDEETHRKLMRLYALTGNKFQALEQYKQCREILSREIGEEPEPATRELGKQILLGKLQPLPQFHIKKAAQSVPVVAPETDSDDKANSSPDRRVEDGLENYSLAVLPFICNQAHPHSQYLAGTLTESVINTLSKSEELRVVAHEDVLAFMSSDVSPREAACRLGVKTILVGKLLGTTARLSVKAELIKALDGTSIWEAVYAPEAKELLCVKDRIAGDVETQLTNLLSIKDRANGVVGSHFGRNFSPLR